MEGDSTTASATALILTGGKSSRMGRPKALLPFDDEPLIAHVVRKLNAIFAEVVVVAAPDQELPDLSVTLARDDVAYQGPVSGIYHGLQAASKEVCFVTSCDAPFLNRALIAHLVTQIHGFDVVVPFWQERFQPLHAVYRRSVTPLLGEQLERGELRPVFLYDKVRTRKVSEEEISWFDPEGLSFVNMNSLADYENAQRLWREKKLGFISVSVELFGVARMLAKTQGTTLTLPQNSTVAHVLSALRERFPALAGRVINSDRLIAGYACNINGLDFVRTSSTTVKSGDKIMILSADAGG
jgi:molybdopterin-guanine dinucleotide biosynthesis protein A/molybdopterin converting factor small subunit